MQFRVHLTVRSDKKGLSLDKEYDRLQFEDFHTYRPKTFVRKMTIEVDKAFAMDHFEYFGDYTEIYLDVKTDSTTANDYEDWGSVGMMLDREKFPEERIRRLMLEGKVSV